MLASFEEEGLPVPSALELKAKLKEAYSVPRAKDRSYIYDYTPSLDICQHPEIMPIHGFTSAPGTDPGPLVPLFTFAKTNIHSDILVTPLEQYSDSYIGYDPDWEKKDNNKLMWRGSTTGIDFYVENDWKNSQRARLHFATNEKEGNRNVLIAEGEGAISEKQFSVKTLNDAYMDVSFAGGPVQCDEETCEIMREMIDFRPTMGLNDAYKVSTSLLCVCTLRADRISLVCSVQIRNGCRWKRMVRSIPSIDVDESMRSQIDSLPRMVRRSNSTLGPVSFPLPFLQLLRAQY